MDIPTGFVPVNGFEVRGRTSSTEKNFSRDSSMSLTQSSIIYHERMANNGMDIDQEPTVESSALSYETEQEKALCLGKVTETSGERQQCDAAPNDDDDNDNNVMQLPMTMMTTSSIFNFRTTPIRLLNQNSGAVTST